MPQYRVTWEIDVEADTPEEAAQQARDAQVRPGTTAVVFEVKDEAGEVDLVDLNEVDTESSASRQHYIDTGEYLHKARPSDPESDAEQPCAVCLWNVKKVPGGQGPTWIHTETGAVAAPGAEPEPGKVYDHDPRPNDDTEPEDRCKDCGELITWMGPSLADWMHVNDVRNQ